MRNQLHNRILSIRGGLQIWRKLSPILEKMNEDEVLVLSNVIEKIYAEGQSNGTASTKSKARRLGFFI